MSQKSIDIYMGHYLSLPNDPTGASPIEMKVFETAVCGFALRRRDYSSGEVVGSYEAVLSAENGIFTAQTAATNLHNNAITHLRARRMFHRPDLMPVRPCSGYFAPSYPLFPGALCVEENAQYEDVYYCGA